jgi:tetratricopeptide (TPR) repeat protein
MMVQNRSLLGILCVGSVASFIVPHAKAQEASPVMAWEETIAIPTYLPGPPDLNPMFYFGRASQGAEGRIYPYPLYDNLTDKKEVRSYRIVYLENEYVKIGILPEIGGRIFSGVDKTNGYDFFYRQHVIKPALIGLTGAWISGGVEWNIPHHHRATTFVPVQYRIEEHPDGSRTVWVGELELRHRMRWAVGHTLRPGKSYLETSIRIVNRTPLVNTMLAFANAAVHANEDYQIIFPPSTQHVTHHHKRQFTTLPVATTRYGGADFRAGVDVSWYKNHYHGNSMFAWNYEEDFLAGYDHGRQAGTMCVADHHVVPGKKFWTWGTGPRGRMWDEILTDDDGPYVELMVGAYSDNQPDYSWLQPFESRAVEMYWYPFRDIGGVKRANLDAAVNLELVEDGSVKVGFYTTAAHPVASLLVEAGDEALLRDRVSIGPGTPYVGRVVLPAGVDVHDVRASIVVEGRELVAYSPVILQPEPMPAAVEAPPPPGEFGSVEELFLAGQRIDQFHNPALDPEPYWEEALRRDPGDSRVNTALGILALKRGRYEEAEEHLRTAIARVTDQYTVPKDAEPLYYIGVALKAQGKLGDAFDAFSRATWSAQWRDASHYSLAELSTLQGDFAAALHHVDRSIDTNARNLRALNLKASVLRHLSRADEARQVLEHARRQTDPLDVRLMAEHWLLTRDPDATAVLDSTLRHHPATGLETAVEYMNAGLWNDAAAILDKVIEAVPDTSGVSPMVHYYLGYVADHLGDHQEAAHHFRTAIELPPDYVFPFQDEAIAVLRRAIELQPHDARARYYLGNLLFDWQPEEAIRLWSESAALDPSYAIVHRNLALAWSHQGDDASLDRAITSMETAVSLTDRYPIHFFELDRLYEAAGRPPEDRLAMLERHYASVIKRDDATARTVNLKIFMGKSDEAIELMTNRVFDIWEGGVRFNPGDAWTDAHLQRGRQRLASRSYRDALADFEAALNFPANLRAERPEGAATRQPEVSYWIAVAQEALGHPEEAREAWQEAATLDFLPSPRGSGEVSAASGIQLYHQALALRELGHEEQSVAIFREIRQAGQALLDRSSTGIGFFSSFGERQSQRAQLASGLHLVGLGDLGLGEEEMARDRFGQALAASPDHLGAKTALDTLGGS